MSQRQCGSCTKCCDGWINADINGVKISPTKPCEFRTDGGCAIYEKRPEMPCRTFKCGWLSDNSVLPEHMSPVNCGAIVLFNRKWRGYSVVYALPTGPKIPQETLDWLMNYTRETKIPLQWVENTFKNGVYTGQRYRGYGPPAFINEIKNGVNNDDIFM